MNWKFRENWLKIECVPFRVIHAINPIIRNQLKHTSIIAQRLKKITDAHTRQNSQNIQQKCICKSRRNTFIQKIKKWNQCHAHCLRIQCRPRPPTADAHTRDVRFVRRESAQYIRSVVWERTYAPPANGWHVNHMEQSRMTWSDSQKAMRIWSQRLTCTKN